MNTPLLKTIKRYPNRKLYDTTTSRYITLEELGRDISEGIQIQVVDSVSKEDITTVTLAQILVEQERGNHHHVPVGKLLSLLHSGGVFIQRTISEPVQSIKDEANRKVHQLLGHEPAEEFRDLLLRTHKAYEDVQKKVDERLQTMLGSLRSLSGLATELGQLKEQIKQLEQRIKDLEEKAP